MQLMKVLALFLLNAFSNEAIAPLLSFNKELSLDSASKRNSELGFFCSLNVMLLQTL
jgi:hypothetical protein